MARPRTGSCDGSQAGWPEHGAQTGWNDAFEIRSVARLRVLHSSGRRSGARKDAGVSAGKRTTGGFHAPGYARTAKREYGDGKVRASEIKGDSDVNV